MHAGKPRGDVGLDLHDVAVQTAHGHRERPPQRHQPTPCRWVISGPRRRPMRTPMTSMRTAAQLPSWRGQPQPGQPPQPAHLLRRHGLCDATELVAGAGLHLDEHHDARRVVGGDHVQFAVSATPIAGQHPQPQRLQMLDRQLLSECADLGAGQRSHGAHRATRCRQPAVDQRGLIPNRQLIHNRDGFATVKKRVHGDHDRQDPARRRRSSDRQRRVRIHRTRRLRHQRCPASARRIHHRADRLRLRRQRRPVRRPGDVGPPDRRRRDPVGRPRSALSRLVSGGLPKRSSAPSPARAPDPTRTTHRPGNAPSPSGWRS